MTFYRLKILAAFSCLILSDCASAAQLPLRISPCSLINNDLSQDPAYAPIILKYHVGLQQFHKDAPAKIAFGRFQLDRSSTTESQEKSEPLSLFAFDRMLEIKSPVLTFFDFFYFGYDRETLGADKIASMPIYPEIKADKHGLMKELEAAIREAMRRNPQEDIVLYFDLTGISLDHRDGESFPNQGTTTMEIYLVLKNPDIFKRTKWYLKGRELSKREVQTFFGNNLHNQTNL